MEGSAVIRIPFTEHLGVQIVESNKEHALVSLQRRPELLNSWGATHGGVIMTMLDLVMSWAVCRHRAERALGQDKPAFTDDRVVRRP